MFIHKTNLHTCLQTCAHKCLHTQLKTCSHNSLKGTLLCNLLHKFVLVLIGKPSAMHQDSACNPLGPISCSIVRKPCPPVNVKENTKDKALL